jgi:hypothetical protein
MLMYSPSSEPRLAVFKVGFLWGPVDSIPTDTGSPYETGSACQEEC